MTSKGGQTLTYGDANHKHAVTAYNGVTYGYDANGCMTTRGSQSIKYNPENMPVRVSSGGSRICRFAYDGDNVRRKRLDDNGTIHYLGAFERNLGNGLDTTQVDTKYYTVALGKLSRLIAFRKGGTLYDAGTDHLGSTIRVTDATFNALDQMRYKPYGESRDAGTNLKTDHKFTSQIEDAVVGLYWYNSRAYDPAIGRFVVPDTIVPEPGNPQAMNRYSYVMGNPLKFSDPSGHAWEDDFASAHGGKAPTYQDRFDFALSIATGYAWTDDDWNKTHSDRQELWSLFTDSYEVGTEDAVEPENSRQDPIGITPTTVPVSIGPLTIQVPTLARGKKQEQREVPANRMRVQLQWGPGGITLGTEGDVTLDDGGSGEGLAAGRFLVA